MTPKQSRILATVICSFVLWGAIGVLTGALLPNIMSSFALSTLDVGVLVSFWSACFVAGSWVTARLVSFCRLNSIFIAASGLAAIALAALYQAQMLWLFAIAFIMVGALMGVSETIGHSMVGISFPVNRTSMLSVLDVAFSLGSILAPLGVIAIAMAGLAWQFLYLLFSISLVLLFAIGYFYLPAVAAAKSSGAASNKPGLLRYIDKPHLLFLGLTGVFLGVVEWAQNLWIVTYALGEGYSEFTAQIAFATYLGGMLLVRVVTIFVADCLQSGSNSIYLLASALLGNIVLLYAPGVGYLLLGNFLIGLGTGAIFPIALGRAMDFSPQEAAISSATLLMGVIAGSQIAALFLGWLADQPGGIGVAFHTTTIFFVLLIICFAIFRAKTSINLVSDTLASCCMGHQSMQAAKDDNGRIGNS